MPQVASSLLLIIGACTLAATQVHAASDSLMVVVDNGPLAGSYSAPAEEIMCIREKPPSYSDLGYGVQWRRFKAYGSKVLAEAALEVLNPEKNGGKYGNITITFGDPDHNPTSYHVYNDPLIFKLIGTGFTMFFEGKTSEGIRLHVTASCVKWESIG